MKVYYITSIQCFARMHFTHPTTGFSMGTANDSLEFPFKMAYQYTCRHLSYSDFLLKLQRFNIFFLLDLFIWSPWWPLLNDILKKVYLIWRIYKTIREGTLNTNQSNILFVLKYGTRIIPIMIAFVRALTICILFSSHRNWPLPILIRGPSIFSGCTRTSNYGQIIHKRHWNVL